MTLEFETQRLLLRQWKPTDREPWAELNADPGVMAHFPALLTREQSDALAERCQQSIEERGWGPWATEAAHGALYMGFEVLKLPEIVSFTVPSNIRSRAVMERLGMRMDEGTFEHPGVPERHPLRTHCSYRLSRDAWRSSALGPAATTTLLSGRDRVQRKAP